MAIVHRDGPEWVAGLGTADVASGRATSADTLFRIGSTSKAFASLSILMLADQGKLSLDDPVHQLVPDVWFENRWEATDPVRVVNLLEHTTGWDDMHLREYAKDAAGMSLRDGLDYDHHSRVSRWPPGTRMAYCNSGPPVAAYIVEKLTEQRFEDYVQLNLFLPIGMKTATYFEPAPGTATTLYHNDGKTPYRYWNILLRPAGSINASANDMAAYVQFYLNRGAVNGKMIVPASDIDRMEIPRSTWAAKDGMKDGYGLSNYWSIEDGFVYHGHDGGVEGGLTEMAYMADYNVGYFFSINSGNGDAFGKVAKAIRSYITKKLQRPPLPAAAPLPTVAAPYAGWYVPDSPRVELTHFLDRLFGITWLRFKDGNLVLNLLGAWNETYVPVEDKQFRHVPKKSDDAPDPVATFELLTPNHEGRFVQAGMGTTMKQYPGMAGHHADCRNHLCAAFDGGDSGVCAILDSWRTQQETPAPGRTRPAHLASGCSAQPDCICGHLYHVRQRPDRAAGQSDRLVCRGIPDDRRLWHRLAGERNLFVADSSRSSSPRRAQVLAHGYGGLADRDCLPRLLGHHRIADLGLDMSERRTAGWGAAPIQQRRDRGCIPRHEPRPRGVSSLTKASGSVNVPWRKRLRNLPIDF